LQASGNCGIAEASVIRMDENGIARLFFDMFVVSFGIVKRKPK